MSGVTGNDRINKKDMKTLKDFCDNLLKDFEGFEKSYFSGSYIADKSKKDFGDLDLIVQFTGYKDKAKLKRKLARFFEVMSDAIIVPFQSEKYFGKKYNNAGELISISLNNPEYQIGPKQVDLIVALSKEERIFKQKILDIPAEKQGLLIALSRVALNEKTPKQTQKLLDDLGIDFDIEMLSFNQELEFVLSTKSLALRLVTYDREKLEKNEFKEISRDVVYELQDFESLEKVLSDYDLSKNFQELLKEVENKLKKPRSFRRLLGIFTSMVTVKSGEVGTKKAETKEHAIADVQDLVYSKIDFKSYYKILKESKENSVGIFIGRFQPCTKAHKYIIDEMKKNHDKVIVYIVKGSKTSKDLDKNPLDFSLQKKAIKSFAKDVEVIKVNNGFFPDFVKDIEEEKITLYCGEDRKNSYLNQLRYVENKIMNIEVLKRNDEDTSATKVRNAIKKDDEKLFKSLVPRETWKFYGVYKEFIN